MFPSLKRRFQNRDSRLVSAWMQSLKSNTSAIQRVIVSKNKFLHKLYIRHTNFTFFTQIFTFFTQILQFSHKFLHFSHKLLYIFHTHFIIFTHKFTFFTQFFFLHFSHKLLFFIIYTEHFMTYAVVQKITCIIYVWFYSIFSAFYYAYLIKHYKLLFCQYSVVFTVFEF